MAMNPLHQFEIHELTSLNVLGYNVQVTNQSLWMIIATLAVSAFLVLGIRKKAVIPGRFQAAVELTFEFVQNLVKSTTGTAGLSFMPIIFTIFLFVCVLNVFGMIPGSYTSTSQIFITGAMSAAVFLFVVMVGFYKHGLKFLGMFYPEGTPMVLAPFIVVLEMISFFARPFTLAVRLGANMMAGHILLKIVAAFVIMMGIAGIVPLAFLIALSALELFVAILQAYIFTVLSCVYLNDALHLH